MLKASALYMVIVIALVIAVLCSSLIVLAYVYRLQYQHKFRADQLRNNISSGVNILLGTDDKTYDQEKTFSLFNTENDSVTLHRIPWGVYDIGIVRAFIQKDTLYSTFSIARSIDSTKWAALYIIDEDRPLSVSGKTTIRGNVFIPKAGVREAYIDGKAYEGDKRIVIGRKLDSEKTLPALDSQILQQLSTYFSGVHPNDSLLLKKDSVFNSFLRPTRSVNFKKTVTSLSHIKLNGNIILYSDTLLIIDSTVTFNNVLVFAKAINIKRGFHGTCQLFARDSISVERDCRFDYPSCLGVLRTNTPQGSSQEKVFLGEDCSFNGILFTYEKDPHIPPFIDLSKKVVVTGQVYSQGIVNIHEGAVCKGSCFTNRFVYQSTYTKYENYLVSTTLDATALSPYYLTSGLLPVAAKTNKILQWLEAN